MRILHIINFFQPVLGYQETFLARTQSSNGHSVRVLTSDRYSNRLFRGGASRQLLGKRLKGIGLSIEEGVEVERLPVTFEVLGSVWLRGLEKAITDFKPDAVHIHGLLSINTVRVLRLKKHLMNMRVILDDHMTYNATRGWWVKPFYVMFRILFMNLILRNADGLVAVTEETRDFMMNMYGIPFERIKIIPLGCDAAGLQRDERLRREIRNDYGIQEDEVVFCYVGKIIPEKGVDILVEASIALMNSGERIRVFCVGGRDAKYLERLNNRIGQSGQTQKFILLPAVPNKELYRIYSIADVGVWPKQCSITMLEAMACELPVIISDGSGATERVQGRGNGLIYHEGDIGDLEVKMKALMHSQARESMGRTARLVAESCDWKSISAEFERLYST